MGCNCGGRKNKPRINNPTDIMGGYKYLTANQIKVRLEAFKKKYCRNCEEKYKCDLGMYKSCNKRKGDRG